MLKKKIGIIVGILLIIGLLSSGVVYAINQIEDKERIVETQKESLSKLETEKEALKKETELKSKVIEDTKKTLSEKEQAVKDAEKALKDKDKALEEKESQIKKLEKDLSAKAKKKQEELKAEKEVVVASATPASSTITKTSKPREKEEVIVPSRSNNEPSGRTFYVEATAYTALCDTGCTGITATGINLLQNPGLKVIAVDPSVIPLGSKVYVEGYGYAIAGDTGGAIKGNKIDLYMQHHSDAVAFGRQKLKITILE